MVHFIPIPPEDLTPEERILLVKIIPFDYDGRTAVDVIRAALANQLQFWRIQGEMTGLLITRLAKDKGGKTLWIEGIGGEGLVENLDKVIYALILLASRAACSSLSGLVERSGMQKMIEKGNLPVVAQIFRKEISDAPA